MLSGMGGYHPGDIKKEALSVIANKEIEDLIQKIIKAGFWDMTADDEVDGFDGSQMVVEVILNRKYRVLQRWTPEYQTEERNLRTFVKLYEKQFQSAGFWEKDTNY